MVEPVTAGKKRRKPTTALVSAKPAALLPTELLGDIRALIEAGRERTAQAVNRQMVVLYWRVGHRIREAVLGSKRAAYGERVLELLGTRLSADYGRGFSRFALGRMVKFAAAFEDPKIVATLSLQLGWSHFVELLTLSDPLKREFYAQMCRQERWSVRTLHDRIRSLLFERTALSQKPARLARRELEALGRDDRLTADLVFRDPYLLDFLKLEDTYSERDLESAILREMERFLLELGTDFTFVARQKRMSIGGEDFHLDLLFFHRGLRCLVAVELKLGRFDAAHKGQMELYLNWLARHERRPEESAPIGLVLCSEKNHEQIELLQLDRASIRVAEYLTALPPRELLTARLQEAIRVGRERFEARPPEKPDPLQEAVDWLDTA